MSSVYFIVIVPLSFRTFVLFRIIRCGGAVVKRVAVGKTLDTWTFPGGSESILGSGSRRGVET
jgi:hypothetical protein